MKGAYLASLRLCILLLDLDFHNVARVLNDLRHESLVASTDLSRNTFSQVEEASPHPVLPENANARAKGRKVGLDHAESSVD